MTEGDGKKDGKMFMTYMDVVNFYKKWLLFFISAYPAYNYSVNERVENNWYNL